MAPDGPRRQLPRSWLAFARRVNPELGQRGNGQAERPAEGCDEGVNILQGLGGCEKASITVTPRTGNMLVWNNLNYQTVRTNFDTFGGEMAKQQKYPEVYLGDPEIDFVMLAKSQGIEGRKVTEPRELEGALRRGADAMRAGEPYLLDVRVATVGAGADSTWHQRFKLRG